MRKSPQVTVSILFILLFTLLSSIGFFVKQKIQNDSYKKIKSQLVQVSKASELTPVYRVPDTFPTDVPIIPDSIVTSATGDVSLGVGMDAWLSLQTNERLDRVLSYYKQSIVDNGWMESAIVNTPLGHTLTATKNQRQVTISMEKTKNENGIHILIFVMKKV